MICKKSVFATVPGYLILCCLIFAMGCRKEMPIPKDYSVTCYAAGYSKGIFKSDNGGTSWFPLGEDHDEIHAYFKRLIINPQDADKLYIATAGAGLFNLDTNTGGLVNIDLFRDKNITSLSFGNESVMQGTGNLLSGVFGEGIYQCSGNLEDWHLLNNGLVYHDVNMIYSDNNGIYAGTVKEFFKWDESSGKWIPASDGIKNKNIISFDAGPENTFLFAGSGAYGEEKGWFEKVPCLYKSLDQGQSWSASDTGIPDGTLVYTVAVNPEKPERIYLGVSDGVYRSTDEGQTWEKMEDGLPANLKTFDIKIARMSDGVDVVYAAGSNGVYMAIDDDETRWVSKSYGLEKTAITSIVLVPN